MSDEPGGFRNWRTEAKPAAAGFETPLGRAQDVRSLGRQKPEAAKRNAFPCCEDSRLWEREPESGLIPTFINKMPAESAKGTQAACLFGSRASSLRERLGRLEARGPHSLEGCDPICRTASCLLFALLLFLIDGLRQPCCDSIAEFPQPLLVVGEKQEVIRVAHVGSVLFQLCNPVIERIEGKVTP